MNKEDFMNLPDSFTDEDMQSVNQEQNQAQLRHTKPPRVLKPVGGFFLCGWTTTRPGDRNALRGAGNGLRREVLRIDILTRSVTPRLMFKNNIKIWHIR